MTTAAITYPSTTALSITLASLAASATAGRQSAVIDNAGADLGIDAIVTGKFTTGTTPTVNTLIEFWAYGTADGTNYSGNAGTTDVGFTPTAKATMKLLELITVTATSNVTYVSGSWSIANAFGGTMPRKWGVWVLNNTGATFNATAGNFVVQYSVVKYTNA